MSDTTTPIASRAVIVASHTGVGSGVTVSPPPILARMIDGYATTTFDHETVRPTMMASDPIEEHIVESTEFVYVADAMCSWCWGFSPTISGLQERFSIPIRLVNGGLRPGPNAEKLDDEMRAMLEHHWHQVAQASSQPFDTSFLERSDGWIYDTELPAMAMVTVREMAPELTLPVFERLQRAFYAEATDITDPSVYRNLLEPTHLDTEAFLAAFGSETARWKAWEDFEEARSMGITGFPALLLRNDGNLALVTRGWAPITRLAPAIEAYLRNQMGSEAEGLMCHIDDPNC